LLNFLAEHLPPGALGRTTVVFDAAAAPPGLPRLLDYRGLTVRFAARRSDADSLIEELIQAEPDPRHLTVVSSDHRLHRAARRRKCKAVDSDAWYAELIRPRPRAIPAATSARPELPLLADDVEYWISQFGGQSALERWLLEENPADTAPPTDRQPHPPVQSDKPGPEELDLIDNPFPPGYCEEEKLD